jgi:hypothetical protein
VVGTPNPANVRERNNERPGYAEVTTILGCSVAHPLLLVQAAPVLMSRLKLR